MLRSLPFGSSVRIIIVIAVATSVGVTLLLTLAPEPDSRKLPPRIPFAQTARVSAGSGPMPVYGARTVRPSAEIDIAPQVGGRAIWVGTGFQSERRVEDGGTLLRIEEADYLDRPQEAEGSLASHAVEVVVPLSDPDASLIPACGNSKPVTEREFTFGRDTWTRSTQVPRRADPVRPAPGPRCWSASSWT